MLAARTGRREAVQSLIARGANVNASESWQGETALMWAAAEDHPEVVALLARSGADLNARSKIPEFPKVKVDAATMVFTALPKGGFTALLLAARQGAMNGIKALAEAGADLDATDPDGTTALNLAIINAHYDVAALLVEKGANPNAGDAAGMTPLYAAIDMQHQEPLVNRPLPRPSGRLASGRCRQSAARTWRGSERQAQDTAPDAAAQRRRPVSWRGGDAVDARGEGRVTSPRCGLLLDKGADPNLRLRNQSTALMIAAARQGRNAPAEETTVDAMKLLIDQRSRPEPCQRQRRNGVAHRRQPWRRARQVPG